MKNTISLFEMNPFRRETINYRDQNYDTANLTSRNCRGNKSRQWWLVKHGRVYLISTLCPHACYVVIVFARLALNFRIERERVRGREGEGGKEEEGKLYTRHRRIPRGCYVHGKAIKCDKLCKFPPTIGAISNAIITRSVAAISRFPL